MTRCYNLSWWVGVGLLGLSPLAHAQTAGTPPDPQTQTQPALGPAQAIGAPANGCLAGGVALPLSGPGWDVTRPQRNRFWGHPRLIAVLQTHAAPLPASDHLLIGDLSMPRGGRMPNGHASHQMGLDADLQFQILHRPLTDTERADPSFLAMVSDEGQFLAARWTPQQTAILRGFAEDPAMERIFVNPAIKQALCQTVPAETRSWLHKIRPWWGHAAHFHIRLACPEDSPACTPGPVIPDGDGCGAELADWLVPGGKPLPPSSAAPPPSPPAACVVLWQAP